MFNSVVSSAVGQQRPVVPAEAESAFEIGLARSRDDLIAAFRLLYMSYVRAGLASENDEKLRLTPFHALSTTEVFVAKCRGEIISTMTMVGNGELGLPMQSMYRDEIASLTRSGARLAEMGCFADRRTSPTRFKEVFNQLARLVVQVASARRVDALVAATHPKHARFYVRWLGFEHIGEMKQCTYAAGNPAVALLLDFDAIQNTPVHDRLFGQSIAPEYLTPTHWDAETIVLLQRLVQSNATPTSAAPAAIFARQLSHPTYQQAVVMPPGK